MAEVNKVRVELLEQIGHLQAERAAQEGLREKIAALERQLKGEGHEGWGTMYSTFLIDCREGYGCQVMASPSPMV